MGDIAFHSESKCRPPLGVAVGALAAKQWGVVSLAQLVGLGLAPGTVRTWAARGRLVLLHRGVYAVGHAAVPREGRWLAAVLACGLGAVLSHRSAAALWGMLSSDRAWVDVSVPRGRRGPRRIAVHRPRALRAEDVTVHRGIPITTPARTLADLGRVLPRSLLENAAARAERQGLLSTGEVMAFLGHEPRLTRGELERLFLGGCRQAALPEPEMNVWLTHGGGEEWQADALFRAHRVIAEIDDRGHMTSAAFEDDRHRDAIRQADGYATLRFTERQLRTSLPSAISVLASVLSRRAASPAR